MAEKDAVTPVKIVLMGETNVGKTSIGRRFTANEFSESEQNTVGGQFTPFDYDVDGQLFSIALWDTAGQETYRSLVPQYSRDANIALIVFAIDSHASFDGLQQWVDTVERENVNNCQIVICGNKVDLQQRDISFDEANAWAEKHHMLYYETSAKTGQGVAELFRYALTEFKQRNDPAIDVVKINVDPENGKDKPEKKKCKC